MNFSDLKSSLMGEGDWKAIKKGLGKKMNKTKYAEDFYDSLVKFSPEDIDEKSITLRELRSYHTRIWDAIFTTEDIKGNNPYKEIKDILNGYKICHKCNMECLTKNTEYFKCSRDGYIPEWNKVSFK